MQTQMAWHADDYHVALLASGPAFAPNVINAAPVQTTQVRRCSKLCDAAPLVSRGACARGRLMTHALEPVSAALHARARDDLQVGGDASM